jgi:hypothetical protein
MSIPCLFYDYTMVSFSFETDDNKNQQPQQFEGYQAWTINALVDFIEEWFHFTRSGGGKHMGFELRDSNGGYHCEQTTGCSLSAPIPADTPMTGPSKINRSSTKPRFVEGYLIDFNMIGGRD